MAESNFIWGTGRRKSSVARVRIRPGTGTVVVNGREPEKYFDQPQWLSHAFEPLRTVDKVGAFDIFVNVSGGGLTGQSGAVAMGLARALTTYDREAHYVTLRQAGLVTRDARMKERKKYGLRGARRAFQFSKR